MKTKAFLLKFITVPYKSYVSFLLHCAGYLLVWLLWLWCILKMFALQFTHWLNNRRTTQIIININAMPTSTPIMAGSMQVSGPRLSWRPASKHTHTHIFHYTVCVQQITKTRTVTTTSGQWTMAMWMDLTDTDLCTRQSHLWPRWATSRIDRCIVRPGTPSGSKPPRTAR